MHIHPDDLTSLVRSVHRGLPDSLRVAPRESLGSHEEREAPLLHRIRVLTYPPLFTAEKRDGGCRIARLHPFQFVIPADVEHQFAVYEETANAAIMSAVQQVQ